MKNFIQLISLPVNFLLKNHKPWSLSLCLLLSIGLQQTTAQTTVNLPQNCAVDLDTDGDGTANSTDTDDDGDGVADTSDNCPLVYGDAANNGCPSFTSNGGGYQAPAVSGGVLDISGMASGECFSDWPTGVYAVKINSSGTAKYGILHSAGAASHLETDPIDFVPNAYLPTDPAVFGGGSDIETNLALAYGIGSSAHHEYGKYNGTSNGTKGIYKVICRTE